MPHQWTHDINLMILTNNSNMKEQKEQSAHSSALGALNFATSFTGTLSVVLIIIFIDCFLLNYHHL